MAAPLFAAMPIIAVLLVLAPFVALVRIAMEGSGDLWPHLAAYVIPHAAMQTVILLAGVAAVVLAIGVSTAWLVTEYDFPGRRILEWALLLPLAVPTYVVAFVYLDLLHPIGPVQGAMRALFGIESVTDFALPDVRSMGGCILLLGLVLYPYVYLSTRAMLLLQPASLVETARTLGAGRWSLFFHVTLPFARPGIVLGASLALLETLNDIGASEFLGVRSMTVSVYSTWVNRSSLPGAAQIALAMLAVIALLAGLERWGRQRREESVSSELAWADAPRKLSAAKGVAALLLAGLPVILGFAVPALHLFNESLERIGFAGFPVSIFSVLANTVGMALIATLVAMAVAFCITYAVRLHAVPRSFIHLAGLGYAVPGTVLAIALLTPLATFDNAFDVLMVDAFGISTGLLLSGSGAALIYAYVARFLVIPVQGIEAGFGKISMSVDEAAGTLGGGRRTLLRLIHIPLLRPALATAALLVFVDCMKELPATLILRPLGFETLATHLYAEASRGVYEDGAIAALLIVLAGLIPIVVLARMARERA